MSAPTAPPPGATDHETTPQPPRPARHEPPRRPYALAVLLIGAGVVWALALLGVSIRWDLVLPVVLIVIGGVLLLSRHAANGGLVGLGIVVLVASLLVAPLSLTTGDDIGERREVVTEVSDLDDESNLGIGSLTLDLRGLDLEDGQVVSVSASVGIGELRVLVPDGATVTGEARAGIGTVQGTEGDRGGLGVTADLEDSAEVPDPEAAVVDLDVQVGIGQVVVTR